MNPPTVTPRDARAAPSAMGPATWTIRLLGAIEAQGPSGVITRWPSRAVAALLARVALAPDRNHPREELIELLWPGVSLEVGRNRLRQALSTLKGLLESSGVTVLQADRRVVRAVPGTLSSDAIDFERWYRAGDAGRALRVYGGELMPGHYEDWVIEARHRFATWFERLDAQLPAAAAPPPEPEPSRTARPSVQLPSHWTRLFGIDHHLDRLHALIGRQRLVSIIGAGGSGKTRLAVEAARTLPAAAADGPQTPPAVVAFDRITFVSLVDCHDDELALDAIASALGIHGRDPATRIAHALAGRPTLLLLDNFEQLVGKADAMLQRLLTDSATLHLLVTSRQRLGLIGEHVYELAGLALPDGPTTSVPSRLLDERSWAEQPALALFVDRARAVRADFQLGPGDVAAATQLLHMLAGMPLAIELAASRMRSLSPRALLGLLTDGEVPLLDLLARGRSGSSQAERHASLRHVVDWSWQQLDAQQIELMAALATFATPASLDTIAAVVELDRHATRERLEALRDSSLLVRSTDALGAARYVLLQPVREFVIERLGPQVATRGRARLRQWLLAFGQRAAARGHAALQEVDAELPLVQATVIAAAADGAYLQAVQIVLSLRRHWELDTRAGLPLSVMQALQAGLDTLVDDTLFSELATLLSFSSALAGSVTDAQQLAERALARAPGPRQRAGALLRLVNALIFSGRLDADIDDRLAQGLALARSAGDAETEGLILRSQFLVAVNRDRDHARAEPLAEQVQALWERLGHRRNASSGLMDRASCWIAQGRLAEAATALSSCEQVALQERYATGAIMSSWQLGRVLLKLRQADAALAAFRRCVQGAWEHHRPAYVADALVLTPGGLALAGHLADAARLQGFAVAHWQRHFGPFYRDLQRDVCFTRRVLRRALGADRLQALHHEGATLTLPDAVALALGAP